MNVSPRRARGPEAALTKEDRMSSSSHARPGRYFGRVLGVAMTVSLTSYLALSGPSASAAKSGGGKPSFGPDVVLPGGQGGVSAPGCAPSIAKSHAH